MKNIFLQFSLAITLILLVSCEFDDIGFNDNGNPNTLNQSSVEVTVATSSTYSGESDKLPVQVTLGQTFNTDVDVEVEATMKNGDYAVGTVTITKGESSGIGTVTLPADDGYNSGSFNGFVDYCGVDATGIVLTEVVKGTHYNVNSTGFSINVLDKVPLKSDYDDRGLNILADWADPTIDFDMRVVDYPITALFESAASGSRYEQDNFEIEGDYEKPDGTYIVQITHYEPTDPMDFKIMFRDVQEKLYIFEYNYSQEDIDADAWISVIQFVKEGDKFTITPF